jgi:hypothetical protein
MIVIFDNFLVLATDFSDAYAKLKLVITRASENRLVLKFSKCWLGFTSAKFFGFVVGRGKYSLGEDRKAAIAKIPFPTDQKLMQRFLGAALFFNRFVPCYSEITAVLNEMVHNAFNWNESSWTKPYRKLFEAFKSAVQESEVIYLPKYELEWILRADASARAVGAVLIQVAKTDGVEAHQPIGLASEKFRRLRASGQQVSRRRMLYSSQCVPSSI